MSWGNTGSGSNYYVPPAPLPAGVCYVDVDGGGGHAILRRSDGQVVVFGNCQYWEDAIPPLVPGTSYVEISANYDGSIARVGPTSTYVSFASGCAGSRPATRLVPLDTPHIAGTLEINLLDLPQDAAVMLFGWNRLNPALALGPYGLPGCSLEVSPDAMLFLAGQNHCARYRLPIPNRPDLVGWHFFNQAVVFDPTANSLGVVLSDAAEGVVGHW